MSANKENIAASIPGYKIIRELGVGGQARVYLAEQESFNRNVAIKTLLPSIAADSGFAARFLREAETVAKLSHPHIIPVYDFGKADGIYYMVMEYFPGGNLKQWIKTGMLPEEALQVLSQVALALNYTHERGIVHRDVKPDNIMFREDNSAVLMDFGIARRHDDKGEQITKIGQVLGTPSYMSPEQILGRKVDGRSDLYALGIMFFQMLTNRLPYEDNDLMALAMKHVTDPIPKLPIKLAKYQRIFERMVAKEPEQRFQNGREVAILFQDILSGKSDVSIVDSVAATNLRSVLEASLRNGRADMVEPKDGQISRDSISFLQDLHPLLDIGWERKTREIFQELTEEKRKFVYKYFLIPKGIYFDQNTEKFSFVGMSTIADTLHVLQTRSLKGIAQKINKAAQSLRTTRNLSAFADLLESSLSLIDDFDCKEDQLAQKERNLLRSVYLNEIILIVRGAQFEPPPENNRKLNVDAVTTYLLQVYIRQRLMGYRFRTLSVKALERHSNDFLRNTVAVQAKIRQCDIVKAGNYLFLIAPVRNIDQNPFSIRRFLHEEKGPFGGSSFIWLHAIAIPLPVIKFKEAQADIAHSISRIIALERQLSQRVIDIVESMEKAYSEELAHLLLEPIAADGTQIEKAIEKRLFDYERALTVSILVKLTTAVTELAKTQDDFEYLLSNARRLITECACDARDFNAQNATTWSKRAEDLDLRMISYLRLLDKREKTLGPSSKNREQDPSTDSMLPIQAFKSTIKEYTPQLKKLNIKLSNAVRKRVKQEKSFFYRWLTAAMSVGKKKITPEMIEQEISRTKQKCLVSLIRICKRYPEITVYLELEGLIPVDDAERHYALPSGIEGLARLPALIRLPEDKDAFDAETIAKHLAFDVMADLSHIAPELGG